MGKNRVYMQNVVIFQYNFTLQSNTQFVKKIGAPTGLRMFEVVIQKVKMVQNQITVLNDVIMCYVRLTSTLTHFQWLNNKLQY